MNLPFLRFFAVRSRIAAAAATGLLVAAGFGNQGPGDKKPPTPPRPIARVPQTYSRERVDQAFKVFDRDHSGWLSFRELRVALEMDRREFVVVDVDQDGAVSVDEFDTHLQRQLENGAVIPWPDKGAASRPAVLTPLTRGPAPVASSEPFSFGDAPAKSNSTTGAAAPAQSQAAPPATRPSDSRPAESLPKGPGNP